MGSSQFLTAKLAFASDDDYSYSNVYSNRNQSKNMVILDWDDTLMCTSFLLSRNKHLSSEEESLVFQLGKKVERFLSFLKSIGQVIIITNSTRAWVKKTAENYLGISLLIFKDVFLYSTRERFKDQIPIELWKREAYKEIESKIKRCKCVICIGDSMNDIEEAKKIKQSFPEIKVATVKFMEKPNDPHDMINEIDSVMKNFQNLFNTDYNMYFETN